MTSGPSLSAVCPGQVLAGKYRVERMLGQGGMGVVVAAHHLQLDEKVALKFLLPEALGNPEAVERFLREARAAVKIKSEHVARVSDVGQLETGSPYIVMEYLEGGDLARWLEQSGALPIEQAVEFVLQALVAIAEAHGLGIVHRDLKPANLFCVRRADGQLSIKVLDFGISKLTDPTTAAPIHAMTRTSALMGSPLYMSPEQMASSRDVDAGADIWALGVILFELVAGKPPFHGEAVTELAIKVATAEPASLRSYRPEAPPQLEAVIRRCLEKERARRYRNVGELALALSPFAARRARRYVESVSGIVQAEGQSHIALTVTASPELDETQVSAGTLPPVGRTTLGSSRGPSAAVGIALVGALVLGGAVAVLALKKSATRPDPGATVAASAPPSAVAAVPPATGADPASAREQESAAVPLAAVPSSTLPTASIAGPAATAAPTGPARSLRTAPPAPVPAPRASPAPVPSASPGRSAATTKPNSDCTLVKYFDDQGAEHFKEECH